jgi:hypothetical protein
MRKASGGTADTRPSQGLSGVALPRSVRLSEVSEAKARLGVWEVCMSAHQPVRGLSGVVSLPPAWVCLTAGQHSGTAYRIPAYRIPLCENFLYGFKAAQRAARAAASARSPSLPLALPLRRRRRRSAGAKCVNAGRLTFSKFIPHGASLLPLPGLSRARSEPVKAVCGRRATASVELPGGRTREDGLD